MYIEVNEPMWGLSSAVLCKRSDLSELWIKAHCDKDMNVIASCLGDACIAWSERDDSVSVRLDWLERQLEGDEDRLSALSEIVLLAARNGALSTDCSAIQLAVA